MGDEWEDPWATHVSGSCFSFFLWNLAPLFFLSFLFLFCILSFLSFVSFISLSLSFFLSFVYSVRFYFLLASFLASLLPSFTPPFFLFSCLLSSFLPRIPFFLPSFQFFSFCPVSSLETLAFRGALFSDKWLQIVYLRDIFAIYLLGDIDVSNYFYLDEERRRTQHISHLSEVFFSNFGFFIISQIWFAMMGIFIIHYDPPKKHGPVFHKLPLCLVVSAFMLRTVE